MNLTEYDYCCLEFWDYFNPGIIVSISAYTKFIYNVQYYIKIVTVYLKQ